VRESVDDPIGETKPWRVAVVECRGSCYDVGVQTAKGFRNSPRGRTFKHRRGRGRYGFSLKNAQAALATYAPNIWEELHGLADGLEIPFETAVMRYSNGRLPYPTYGCSSLSTSDLFGRNYDYSVGKYNSMLLAIQPKGVNASVGFSDRFTGRVDGMNEHGLCVALHLVNQSKSWRPGLGCILTVRIVLDQCATTGEAVKLLKRLPHGLSFNYSLKDAKGVGAVVEASSLEVVVREGGNLVCTNHFQTKKLQMFNRRSAWTYQRLPPLEAWSKAGLSAEELFSALNRSASPVFDHRYAFGCGTMHTLVCEPASRSLLVGVGGDATPQQIDFHGWTHGAAIGVTKLDGQLGGKARPFDADRPPPRRSSRPRIKSSFSLSPRRKNASPWPRRRFTR
jgi:predicted choloylglycine hydrolase